MDINRLSYLKPMLEQEVQKGNIYGCAVTVGTSSGPVFTSTHGDIKNDTYCMLCSMTKPITSVAAWILIERGIIDLNDPVSMYLPGYANPKVWCDGKLEPARREILIRDLLNMTAGVTYGITKNPPKGSPDEQMLNRTLKLRERMDAGEKLSNVDIINDLGQVPLVFHPGEKWEYGKAADLTAAVVEAASGITLGEFFHKEIFEPLGMKNTGFIIPKEQMDHVARIAAVDEAGDVREITAQEFYGDARELYEAPYIENGGGGMTPVMGRGIYSTLDDYAIFCQMLLGKGSYKGVRILSERTVSLFSQNLLTPEQRKSMWPWLSGYGYGNLMRAMVDPTQALSLGTKGEFGWDGALGTYFFVDPESDLYVVYMQQRVGGAIRNKMRNIIYAAL